MKPILNINNLTKVFQDNQVRAVDDVSFSMNDGEIVAIIGPSGSGKSTLLRCINRLVDATSGSIEFDGRNVLKAKGHDLKTIRQDIGMVFQHYNLVYRLNVLENVLHGKLSNYKAWQSLLGLYTKEDVEKSIKLIETFGLGDRVYEKCSKLSGGQKQRVGIARALNQEPKLILCDEPIASLDPQSSKVIMEYLKKIAKEFNIPVLVSLHQVDVAITYADRIIGMSLGKVVFDGKPNELRQNDVSLIYSASKEDLIDIHLGEMT